MITIKTRPGMDNTAFVQRATKKIKKIMMKDKQLRTVFKKQYFVKPSKLRHDKAAKKKHIRQKYGVQI